MEAHAARLARAVALAAVLGQLVERGALELRDHVADDDGGAAGRVQLIAVVLVDDLDIRLVHERPRRDLHQLQHHVHHLRGVAFEDDRDVPAGRFESFELFGREPRAGRDESFPMRHGQVERFEALLHAGNVNERVARVDDGREVVRHGDAQIASEAHHLAEVAADVVASRRAHASHQLHTLALGDESADGLPHLPVASDDDHLHDVLPSRRAPMRLMPPV